ncbi:helix-turn-helix domain-containing protein [Myroides sp. TSA_177.3]|uniref:helix-turn-helix domain-containing protein n=1 Tax=Myroides sp. TSA_177.3 TaxID=3415650 RepID=UPI00404659BB
MPINLLKHILDNQTGSLNTDRVTCYRSTQHSAVVDGYYVYKQQDFIEKEWMFNDGTHSIILFANRQDHVQISTELKQETFESGWIDRGLQKKVYIHYPKEFEYLLVIRFKAQNCNSFISTYVKDSQNQCLLPIQCFFSDESMDDFFSINSVEERIKFLDSYLSCCISNDTNIESLDQAIQIIEESKGLITVGELTERLDVNYKWLERNFSKYLHFTPKEYISTQRFIQAYLNLHKDSSDLLALAINHGFYDYNHFLKEFKSYTGKTPLEYIAK